MIRATPSGQGANEDNDPGPNNIFVRVIAESAASSSLSTLSRLARAAETPDATRSSISALLETSRYPAAVAIYDVGQGNMNAVVDAYEHPLVFFDLGWPLSFNKKSILLHSDFSPLAPSFCSTIPVVLSHLDWDHWGYAIQSGRAVRDARTGAWRTEPTYRQAALDRAWIMQRPRLKRHSLGPSHINFFQTLANQPFVAGKTGLHIWPRNVRRIKSKFLEIYACKPAHPSSSNRSAFLRNNEALAMKVRHNQAAVLLCGDADYPSIPLRFKRALTGLVAPHHGGSTTSGSMPNPIGHGRMVMLTFGGLVIKTSHRHTY